MASRPLSQCAEPGCRKLVRAARCEKHAKSQRREQDARRHDNGFYHRAAWRRLRDAKRQADPLCERCLEAGRVTPAECVHHVESRRDRPDLELTFSNLMSLCNACHNAVEARGAGPFQ